LFETIQIVNGKLCNINAHNERFNRARNELFGLKNHIDLTEHIKIPGHLNKGIIKCRVLYSESIYSIEFLPYIRKKVTTLQMINADGLEYSYKYLDRTDLDNILKSVKTDEIIIVKSGRITDTSFSNIILYDGSKWITPSDYLLNGTCRSTLLKSKRIICGDVYAKDIRRYRYIKLINAMNNMDDNEPIPIRNIKT